MGSDPKFYFKFALTSTYKKRFALTCESRETYSFGLVVADHQTNT